MNNKSAANKAMMDAMRNPLDKEQEGVPVLHEQLHLSGIMPPMNKVTIDDILKQVAVVYGSFYAGVDWMVDFLALLEMWDKYLQ